MSTLTVSSARTVDLLASKSKGVPAPALHVGALPNAVKECVDNGAHEAKKTVLIPDLFSSIMSAKPILNPNYNKVKLEADAWIKSIIQADDKWAARNDKANFAYLAALWAPEADEEALRMMVDYNNWIFLFDDQFDEGHLKDNYEAAKEEIDRTFQLMDDLEPPVRLEEYPIRYIFQSTWYRLKKRSSQDLQDRWRQLHRLYFDGILKQVKVTCKPEVFFERTIEEYMDMRRGTVGAYPIFPLVEYAHGIHLPKMAYENPSVQECMHIASDLTSFANDIMSYKKDLRTGCEHNLILLLIGQGFSPQEALDKMGARLDDCYKQWYTTLSNVPVWGEEVDQEVLKFVDACRNVPLGHLHWGFMTGRYMGTEGHEVRRTRLLTLP